MHGTELRNHRKALGLTQAQLGKALGVTRQSIYVWETRGSASPMLGFAMAELTRRMQDAGSHGNQDGDDRASATKEAVSTEPLADLQTAGSTLLV